jgi:hypothetical protein
MINHCFPGRLFNDVFNTKTTQRLIVIGLQMLQDNCYYRRQIVRWQRSVDELERIWKKTAVA